MQLIEHIKALSNSKLEHITALETFAHCLRSIYGNCSFISFEVCPDTARYHVRLVFSDQLGSATHIENLLDKQLFLTSEQLDLVIPNQTPIVTSSIHPDLCSQLQSLELPSGCLMAIPLYLDGEIKRWVLVLGYRPEQFTSVDLDQAILLANLAGTYMARIDETRALATANAWVEKELQDITRLQQLLLPQEQVSIHGSEVASWYQAYAGAGGDYYDIANLTDIFDLSHTQEQAESWGIIVADVSGHGASAAVEAAMFDAILRTYRADDGSEPQKVFNYANEHFFSRMLRGSFITAVIITYDPDQKKLIYANAGHPPAILRTVTGEIVYLNQNAGIPLGVDKNWQWQQTQLSVEPGALLVAYTDGIIEALSPQKEHFGQMRLAKLIQQCGGQASECIDAIKSAVVEHQQGYAQMDDQAVVAVKILADG